MKPIIVDAHEDLAENILNFGRDYNRSAAETRQREAGTGGASLYGDTLLGWPDYQRGRVALVFSTIFAAPAGHKLGGWDGQLYATPDEAHQLYQKQLDVYNRLAGDHPDKFKRVLSQGDLKSLLDEWKSDPGENSDELKQGGHPVGLYVLMEGAEGVRRPEELEDWWEWGVRAIGPAWTGTRFCGGTRQPGPLTREGYALLEAMGSLGFVLDISHMDEEAVLQALDIYAGQVIASHANALALLKGMETNRHLSDRVIEGILERDGIIGIVPFNSFLLAGWRKGDRRELVTLDRVVAQIDYICQLAGDARHVGLGTDFDGGFGVQSAPLEVDTIADLTQLLPLLGEKGYTTADIEAILGENWIALLKMTLPK